MIELNCFNGFAVENELAQLFASISHLSLDDCIDYLLSEVETIEEINDELYLQTKRLMNLFWFLGHPPHHLPGCGTLAILADIFGDKADNDPELALFAAIKYLGTLRRRLVTKHPDLDEETQEAITQEHQAAIHIVISYIYHLTCAKLGSSL